MKKLLIFIGFLLFALGMPLLAQAIEPPTGVGDIIVNYKVWFGTMGALAVVVTFFTSLAIGAVNIESKWLKQGFSWVIAIILCAGANVIGIGFIGDMPVGLAIINGLVVGLVANGVHDVAFWKPVLDAVEALLYKSDS